MIPAKIDEQKCVGCALCAGDCPNACLCLEGGKARAREGARCIACGAARQALTSLEFPCGEPGLAV